MPPVPNRIKLNPFNPDDFKGLDPKVTQYCREHGISTPERLYGSITVVPEVYAKTFKDIGVNFDELMEQLTAKIPEERRKQLQYKPNSQKHGTGLILED